MMEEDWVKFLKMICEMNFTGRSKAAEFQLSPVYRKLLARNFG